MNDHLLIDPIAAASAQPGGGVGVGGVGQNDLADPFTDNFPAGELDLNDWNLIGLADSPVSDVKAEPKHEAMPVQVPASVAALAIPESMNLPTNAPVASPVAASAASASAASAAASMPMHVMRSPVTAHSADVLVRVSSTDSESKSANSPAPPMSPADKQKEKLAQRKLRNKESARRYREKQVARRRQLENFTRTLAEQNRELEALHDRLLALTCERRQMRAGNNAAAAAAAASHGVF